MKTWELQNSQLLNCSVNWKNLEVHSRLIFQNPNFQYFPWIGKKLRVPARATFKNPNVQSLCELGKTWEYHQSPTFKSTNFESIDELRRKGIDKKFPYLSSTAGNKIRNLHKAGHISTLIWWMRYSISSNLKNLFMNWVKYVSSLGKIKFLTYWKFWTHHRIFDLWKSLANTLTPLSTNVNNANINSNR